MRGKAGFGSAATPTARPALLLAALALAGCITPPGGSGGGPSSPFSGTPVFPGHYAFPDNYSRVLTPGPYPRLPDEVVDLKSNVDGADIRIGIARPDVPNGTRVPVIAVLSDFFFVPNRTRAEEIEAGKLDTYITRFADPKWLIPTFVPQGYAIALVTTRGAPGSGPCPGVFTYGTSPEDQADIHQAIDWLGARSWGNGNVGTIGGSFASWTQWAAAFEASPHLKTIVPIASVVDWFGYEIMNGAPDDTALGAANAPADPTSPCSGPINEYTNEHRYMWTTGERDPPASSFASVRDMTPRTPSSYHGGVFLVNGFRDPATFRDQQRFAARLISEGLVVKQLYGQWYHDFPDDNSEASGWGPLVGDNPTRRFDWSETLLHWFDRWLKDDAQNDVGPAVEVADETGQWRTEAAWPPSDAKPDELALSADGSLARAGASTGSAPLPPDPSLFLNESATNDCATCVAFTLAPAAREYRFAGEPRLHVTVTPAGEQAILAAYLWLANATGKTMLSFSLMDLRFADGTNVSKPIVPGQPIVARMQFAPLDVVIPAGARLELTIGQGRHPQDPWYDTVAEATSTPSVGPIPSETLPIKSADSPSAAPVILSEGDSSTLTLDTFTRDGSTFFTPPTPTGEAR